MKTTWKHFVSTCFEILCWLKIKRVMVSILFLSKSVLLLPLSWDSIWKAAVKDSALLHSWCSRSPWWTRNLSQPELEGALSLLKAKLVNTTFTYRLQPNYKCKKPSSDGKMHLLEHTEQLSCACVTHFSKQRGNFCFWLPIFCEYFNIVQVFWDKIHYFSCSSYVMHTSQFTTSVFPWMHLQ